MSASPYVGTKVILPKSREVYECVSYCRILLDDTMLNEDAFRVGISDTYMCECGQERETVEHVLLRCSRYLKARSAMKDYLNDILNTVNLKKNRKES